MMHISKTGGSSMCELAFLAGKLNQNFNVDGNCLVSWHVGPEGMCSALHQPAQSLVLGAQSPACCCRWTASLKTSHAGSCVHQVRLPCLVPWQSQMVMLATLCITRRHHPKGLPYAVVSGSRIHEV